MAEYLCEADMSTGEYISRDLALRQLNATCLATDCDNYNGVRCVACAYADAMDFIDAIPAADVQPIRHGRWIEETPKHSRCSCCDVTCLIAVYPISANANFCPNCGARMDLKDGDTE